MRMYRGNGFVRVSKRSAERRYNNGEVLYLCPYKLRPGAPWHPEVAVSKAAFSQDDGVQQFVPFAKEFDALVNEYTHYNCNYTTGEYPAYFIKG